MKFHGESYCTIRGCSVIENRKFHRIQLSAKVTVNYLDNSHEGILGSISLGGATINFNGSAMIPQGDECNVAVVLDETQPPLQLNARITHSSCYRIGVAFINMDEYKINILNGLLKKLTSGPETLKNETPLFIAIP